MSTSITRVPSRLLAALAALAMVASMVAIAPAASADEHGPEVVRVTGESRFDTAAQVAGLTYPDGASDVIVAAGFNFPDALASSGVGGLVDAPILLVNDALDSVPAETSAALADLDPDTVHIAGGTAAVSQAIEDEIEAAGDWTMNRFAGTDRFDTAALMAGVFGPDDVAGSTAIVGTGFVAADSLAAGPLAHFGPHPILLTNTDELPQTTADALEDLEIETVLVLGGEAAVSADVAAELEALESVETVARAAGSNRFETAVEITGFEEFSGGERVMLATGFGLDNVPADALAGGPHGGVFGAELLPINDVRDELPTSIETYLQEIAEDLETIVVLGGEAAVSAAVADAAQAAGTPDVPPTNQTFTVTPADEATFDTTGTDLTRSYTATDFGDIEGVAIDAVDAADADYVDDDGTITFPETGGDAAFDNSNLTLSNVRVDGTVLAGTGFGDDIDVSDAEEVTFDVTVAADGKRVPVVYEPDTAGDLPLDDADQPENAFGVGGQLTFAATLTVAFDADSQDQRAAAASEASFDIELAGNLDGEVAGVDVNWIVSTDSADTSLSAVTAVNQFASGSVTTDAAGEATFTVTGPDADDFAPADDVDYAVIVEVDGFGDDEIATTITWDSVDPVANALEWDEDTVFVAGSTTTSVSVQVLDQFDNPLGVDEGEQIRFNVDTTTTTSVVNDEDVAVAADGTASVSWSGLVDGGDSELQLAEAQLLDSDDNAIQGIDPVANIELVAADAADVYRYEMAELDALAADEANVVGADIDNTLVFTSIDAVAPTNYATGDVVAFDWTDADAFEVASASVSQGTWFSELEDVLDGTSGNDQLVTTNLDAAADTVFDLQ